MDAVLARTPEHSEALRDDLRLAAAVRTRLMTAYIVLMFIGGGPAGTDDPDQRRRGPT